MKKKVLTKIDLFFANVSESGTGVTGSTTFKKAAEEVDSGGEKQVKSQEKKRCPSFHCGK